VNYRNLFAELKWLNDYKLAIADAVIDIQNRSFGIGFNKRK
jgi:hypothetical protein